MILRDGLTLAVVGLGLGAALAAALAGVFRATIVGAAAGDPAAYAVVAALLTGVVVAA